MPPISVRLPDFSMKSIDSGRYQLLNPLGSGSFGVVYRACERLPNTKRTVMRAIKVIPVAAPKSHRSAIQTREMALHQMVSDRPNVVTIHRTLRDSKFIYIVMDFCPGGDLCRVIRKGRGIVRDDDLLKALFLQILDGVESCHANGVYHRDLKPENILLNEDLTQAYVGDFGLATTTSQSTSFNTGTRNFMSPECIDCDDVLYPYDTRRSDIWALGVILVYLATGRLPWHKATLEDGLFRGYLEDPNVLRRMFPISQSLNDLLRDVFTIKPCDMVSIPEFHRRVREIDTFWMTEEDIAASNKTVQRVWNTYRLRPIPEPCSSSSSSSEDLSSEEDSGDVFESDTVSESSDSQPVSQPAQREDVVPAGEAACVPTPTKSRSSLSTPSPPLNAASPCPIARALSSEEFPIRKSQARLARVPDNMAAFDSASSDSDGPAPITPETRPQNLPDVVVAEPLDHAGPQTRGRAIFVRKGKVSGKGNASWRIGTFLRSLVSSRRSC